MVHISPSQKLLLSVGLLLLDFISDILLFTDYVRGWVGDYWIYDCRDCCNSGNNNKYLCDDYVMLPHNWDTNFFEFESGSCNYQNSGETITKPAWNALKGGCDNLGTTRDHTNRLILLLLAIIFSIVWFRELVRIGLILRNLLCEPTVRNPILIAESPFLILLYLLHVPIWNEMALATDQGRYNTSNMMLFNMITQDIPAIIISVLIFKDPVYNGTYNNDNPTAIYAILSMATSSVVMVYYIWRIRTLNLNSGGGGGGGGGTGKDNEIVAQEEGQPQDGRIGASSTAVTTPGPDQPGDNTIGTYGLDESNSIDHAIPIAYGSSLPDPMACPAVPPPSPTAPQPPAVVDDGETLTETSITTKLESDGNAIEIIKKTYQRSDGSVRMEEIRRFVPGGGGRGKER